MSRFCFILFIFLASPSAFSTPLNELDKTCLSQKYHNYVKASIDWYDALIQIAVKEDPKLENVGYWFLKGRHNHFKLNDAVFNERLKNAPNTLNLHSGIESWLNLTQEEVKELSQSHSKLAPPARKVFNFRQDETHKDSYALRAALANLLKSPQKMDAPLRHYNQQIEKLSHTHCKKAI